MATTYFPSPPGAVIAYRATPLEDITDVHWAEGPTSFSVSWSAYITGSPDPFYEAGMTVMNVSAGNLPLLRSQLMVGTVFVGDPPIPHTVSEDSVSGEFPDGASGTISAGYLMSQAPIPVDGSVSYSTTAQGGDRFGGAHFVSISLVISLREIFRGTDYAWSASAQLTGAGSQDLSGIAGSGGSITFTATAQLAPPSISFNSAQALRPNEWLRIQRLRSRMVRA
jgi:hypothetical protein